MSSIITLLTDFGDADGFVGAMRGVILSRAPACRLVDLAHHVPRGDIAKAGRVLARAAVHFPPGTVHCVVVDPGVGSDRRAVAAAAGGMAFIAPDNGVLGPALAELGGDVQAHVIAHPDAMRRAVSQTFHGRDVFAPAAAWLAAGGGIEQIGPPAGALVELPVRSLVVDGPRRIGHVTEVDHYGNLITDIPAAGLVGRPRDPHNNSTALSPPLGVGPPRRAPGTPASGRLDRGRNDSRTYHADFASTPLASSVALTVAGARLVGPKPAYAAVKPGALVLVVGSLGTFEVAVRDGSAAARLQVSTGAPCIVEPLTAESGA